MAIYHYQVQNIGRSSGRSAVACAAYRAGERLFCRETGTEKDYTRKDSVDEKMIMAPDNAPDWVYDREDLWNEIHAKENRKNSRFCREANVAFPRELSREAQIELVRDFVQREYVNKGMVADVCCHNLEGDNPHAHIMLPTRVITPEGFGKKERAWNDKKMLLQQREAWANHCNRSLEREGVRERVDHRSLKEQGIDREPTIHLGSKPHPERIARLESIHERNRTLQALKKELQLVGAHLNSEVRRERALDQQRAEQAKIARDRAAHLAKQRQDDSFRAFENEIENIGANTEKTVKENELLSKLKLRSHTGALKHEETMQGKLSENEYYRKVKTQEIARLESEKGIFSIFKNKRIDAEISAIKADCRALEQEEKKINNTLRMVGEAKDILWKRETPAREAKERRETAEREQRRAQFEREKAQRAALDPRYKKIVKSFGGTLRNQIEFEKQLAAAKNDQERDKMVSSWQQANQKNLSRGRGR